MPRLSDDSEESNKGSPDVDSGQRAASKRGSAAIIPAELKQMAEEDPELFGLRRSGRRRQEVERYHEVDSSEDEPKPNRGRKSSGGQKRTHRHLSSSSDENSERSEGSDEESEQSDSSWNEKNKRRSSGRQSHKSKKSSKSSRGSQKSKKSSKRHNLSESENESSDSSAEESDVSYSSDDDAQRRGRQRERGNAVNYRESSLSESEEDTAAATAAYAAQVETIDRVLGHRIGLPEATGPKTTIYNCEDLGDPNSSFDPEKSEGVDQYLIKWANWSHLHNTWETEDGLFDQGVAGLKKLENYKKRLKEQQRQRRKGGREEEEWLNVKDEMELQLLSEYRDVERIIAENNQSGDLLCKWKCLPYSECTWEDKVLIEKRFPVQLEQFHQLQNNRKVTMWPTPKGAGPKVKNARQGARRDRILLQTQPDYIGTGKQTEEGTNMQLRSYQLAGINFLHKSWVSSRSLILADEMGLGKTVEIATFLSVLYHEHNITGPYLVVIPLSTVVGWQREFANWTPELYTVTYLGDAQSRQLIREFEWWHPDRRHLKFNVLITTYEIVLRDKSFLASVDWAALVVDEAHRLKNDDSLLYRTLQSTTFPTEFRILVTGTPLQNTLRELWALLHFANPDRFDDWPAFEERCQAAQEGGSGDLQSLHQELQPYLLRRTKKVVEKELPAKIERILRVPMSQRQRQIYQWLLARNYTELARSAAAGGTFSGSLINVVMELKKCCNHCDLIIKPDIDYTNPSDMGVADPCSEDAAPITPRLAALLRGSGKLMLLDKLLHRLKAGGHRVLIFSQMVRMLDVLSDYLKLRRMAFQRLDGQTSAVARRQSLDHFNAPGSTDFCFLLSTRAGGLGLNLCTADTVIIYDSDWNPQNDLQAAARAHRIGQKNQVSVYRLVTQTSVEEHILEECKKKMVLDHLVIQRMDASGRTVLSGQGRSGAAGGASAFTHEELTALLKFGAAELFRDNSKEGEEEVGRNGDAASNGAEGGAGGDEIAVNIDEILESAEAESAATAQTSQGQVMQPHEEFLSQFRVITLRELNQDEELGDMEAVTRKTHQENGPDWDEIMPEHVRRKVLDQYEDKFSQADTEEDMMEQEAVKEATREDLKKQRRVKEPGSGASSERGDSDEEDVSEEDDESEEEGGRKRGRARGGNASRYMGFTAAELKRLVKALHHFPDPLNRLDAVSGEAALEDKSSKAIGQVCEEILKQCQEAIEQAESEAALGKEENQAVVIKSKTQQTQVKIGSVQINATKLMASLKALQPLVHLDKLLVKIDDASYKAPRWASKTVLKSIGEDEDPSNSLPEWTAADDRALLKGVAEYGLGAWEQLRLDSDLGLKNKILPPQGGRPNARDLQTRFDFLMNKIVGKTASDKPSALKPRKPPTTAPNNKLKSAENKSGKITAPHQAKQRKTQAPSSGKKGSKPVTKNENSNSGDSNQHASGSESESDNEMFNMCKILLKPMKKPLMRMQESDRRKKEKSREEGEITNSDESRPNSTENSASLADNEDFCADLIEVGNFIAKVVERDDFDPRILKRKLWVFVAKFTPVTAGRLYKLYKAAAAKRPKKSNPPPRDAIMKSPTKTEVGPPRREPSKIKPASAPTIQSSSSALLTTSSSSATSSSQAAVKQESTATVPNSSRANSSNRNSSSSHHTHSNSHHHSSSSSTRDSQHQTSHASTGSSFRSPLDAGNESGSHGWGKKPSNSSAAVIRPSPLGRDDTERSSRWSNANSSSIGRVSVVDADRNESSTSSWKKPHVATNPVVSISRSSDRPRDPRMPHSQHQSSHRGGGIK